MKILALIPARGGSKRIPRKNIREFLGQPIIYYPIDQIINSKIFSSVFVSTEDENIAEIVKLKGIEIPFLRSFENSSDTAGTVSVVYEVLTEFQKRGIEFEYVCVVYPTAVFVTKKMLIDSFELIRSKDADVVVPVFEQKINPLRSMVIKNNRLELIKPEFETVRSQDLPVVYADSGQFYWIRCSFFLKNKNFMSGMVLPYIVDESFVHDINDTDDWNTSENKYRRLNLV